MSKQEGQHLKEQLTDVIESDYQAGLARLDEERAELEVIRFERLKALDTILPLLKNGQPKKAVRLVTPKSSPGKSAKGDKADSSEPELSQKTKVMIAVSKVKGEEVSQPIVFTKLKEVFPDLAATIHATNISKILRMLEEERALKKVKDAHASQPTLYEKASAFAEIMDRLITPTK